MARQICEACCKDFVKDQMKEVENEKYLELLKNGFFPSRYKGSSIADTMISMSGEREFRKSLVEIAKSQMEGSKQDSVYLCSNCFAISLKYSKKKKKGWKFW